MLASDVFRDKVSYLIVAWQTQNPGISPHSPDEAPILSASSTIPGYNSLSCEGSNGAAMGDPTGDADKCALRLDFDRRLLLQFRGSAITSGAGLLAFGKL